MPDRLGRRRVLAGLAGAAGFAALGGAGTRAILEDTETIPGPTLGNPYTGAHLRLDATCRGPTCKTHDGEVAVAFTDIDPPATGTATICLHVEGASAWLWLRTTPPVSTTLGDALELTLTYADGTSVTVDGRAVDAWPLNDLLDVFADGRRLDGGGPADAAPDGSEHCLVLEWSLPDASSLAGESATVEFSFAAIQYRADTTPTNPWNTTT